MTQFNNQVVMHDCVFGTSRNPTGGSIGITDLHMWLAVETATFDANSITSMTAVPGDPFYNPGTMLLSNCPDYIGQNAWIEGNNMFSSSKCDLKDTYILLRESDIVDDETLVLIDDLVSKGGTFGWNTPAGDEGEWCDDVPDEIKKMWDIYEMVNDMEKFEVKNHMEEFMASQKPVRGPFMVPNEHTLPNKEWVSSWDGTPVLDGEHPFCTRANKEKTRLIQHDLHNPEMNVMDESDRMVVEATMVQFGTKYHTANCEFGRISVPLKFNKYLGVIGQPMKLLVQLKPTQRFHSQTGMRMSDRKHPFCCIKVL